jgi:glycosyltransferase involved in cell wall biosynthesis
LRQIPDVPMVVSPSGEFAPGALAIKRYKKRPYLWLAKQLGVGEGVTWHVASDLEAQDTLRENSSARVAKIPLPIAPEILDHSRTVSTDKCPGELKLVYLSRVTPKKNLDFALRLLRHIPASIRFDIYGPLEDQAYWSECQRLIGELPANVKVRYCGLVPLDQVTQVFSSYHLFLFPTRSENFSHAILESLSAGCPVLVSDQTPWRNLQAQGIGWDLPLSEPEQFCAALHQCAMMDQAEFQHHSAQALAFATDFIQNQVQPGRRAYRELYRSVGGR